jgi:hypothetical protein
LLISLPLGLELRLDIVRDLIILSSEVIFSSDFIKSFAFEAGEIGDRNKKDVFLVFGKLIDVIAVTKTSFALISSSEHS